MEQDRSILVMLLFLQSTFYLLKTQPPKQFYKIVCYVKSILVKLKKQFLVDTCLKFCPINSFFKYFCNPIFNSEQENVSYIQYL